MFAPVVVGITSIGVVLLFGTMGMALGGWLGATIFDLTGSDDDALLARVASNVVNLLLVGWLMRGVRRATD